MCQENESSILLTMHMIEAAQAAVAEKFYIVCNLDCNEFGEIPMQSNMPVNLVGITFLVVISPQGNTD